MKRRRIHRTFTLSAITIERLKEIARVTDTPMSRVLDHLVERAWREVEQRS